MSKQPRKSREALERAKTTLILPDQRDPRQLWLLVRQDPTDEGPGCFFVDHGMNFDKWRKRKGFEVLAHSYDKHALTAAARKATLACGPAYQPKFSAHREGPKEPAQKPDPSSGTTATDDDFFH